MKIRLYVHARTADPIEEQKPLDQARMDARVVHGSLARKLLRLAKRTARKEFYLNIDEQ